MSISVLKKKLNNKNLILLLPKVTYVTLGNITKLTCIKVEKGIICDFNSGIANHFDIFFLRENTGFRGVCIKGRRGGGKARSPGTFFIRLAIRFAEGEDFGARGSRL